MNICRSCCVPTAVLPGCRALDLRKHAADRASWFGVILNGRSQKALLRKPQFPVLFPDPVGVIVVVCIRMIIKWLVEEKPERKVSLVTWCTFVSFQRSWDLPETPEEKECGVLYNCLQACACACACLRENHVERWPCSKKVARFKGCQQ